jgi:hypothetical protein
MIKIIVFNGGLGNQMFQYAFYLRLKKEHPLSLFLFDIEKAQSSHSGYELDKVFHINSIKQSRNYRRLKRYWPKLETKFHTIKQENSLKYSPKPFSSHHSGTIYEGFWQSEKFFLPVEPIVRNAFSFQEDILNKKTKEIVAFLNNSNSVSVHIRRGDYLQHTGVFGLCPKEYYDKALSYIKDNVDNPIFVFFSDDIEWAKQNIKCENAQYVTWNHGDESWQDMYLMSQCKHNIIANSSFSWWGSWLNSNTNKIVIAPTPWFNNSLDYDIIPSSWIKVQR